MTPSAVHVDVTAITDTQGATIPDLFSIPIRANQIYGRRKKSERSAWGIAAPALSSHFRHSTLKSKPKAKRWDHHINQESASRADNSLKQAAKYLGKPGLISLGGGLPSSEYFPFADVSLTVPTAPQFTEQETVETGVTLKVGKHDIRDEKSLADISVLFNYGQGHGAAQLLRWVTEHTELVHAPPYSDWEVTLSIGSTSALDMALRMFTNRGDYIISEEYTFSTAVETALPLGVKVAGVKMDAEGLLPDALDRLLATWDSKARTGAKKPFLLYTVPTGQNPTGATQGAERRRQIYRVAQKHDLYIIEDEPYYFLQMQPYVGHDTPPVPPPTSHEEFLTDLVPSYLSMDVDGRVLRMDSFSKVVSPGSRVGWVTASEQVVRRFRMHSDVSTQGPSGISQLFMIKLLEEHWGHEGYLDWLIFIRKEYTQRRDIILGACERFLPHDVVTWVPPMAGMFHWMQINYHNHPHATTKTITEIEHEIWMETIEQGALVMPGSWFYAEKDVEHDTLFFRATYAAAPFDKIQEAIRRFGVAVRKSFALVDDKAAGGVGLRE